MMNGDAKKSSKNLLKIKYYALCPDVFVRYEAFHNNTVEHIFKIMDILKLKTGLLRCYLP